MKINWLKPTFQSDFQERVGIEVKEDSLKLIFLRQKAGRWSVAHVELLVTRSLSEEQVVQELERLLKLHHVRHAQGILILPRNLLFVRYLKLPSHDRQELKNMLGYQIGRHLPYDPHEIVYDFIPLSEEGDYTRILLVAITRKVIEKYLGFLKRVRLPIHEILFSPQLLQRVYEEAKVGTEDPQKTVAFLDFDLGTTNLVILRGNQIVFTRSINLNLDIAEEDFLHRLMSEIDLSLTVLRKEEGSLTISQIVLSGNLEQSSLFKEELSRYFKIPVEALPVEEMKSILWEKPQELWMRLKQLRISIAALVGLCLYNPQQVVNLMPAELQEVSRKERRGREYLTAIYLSAGVLMVAYLCGLAYLHLKQSRLNYIVSQLTDNKQQTKGLANMIQKLDLVQEFSAKRMQSLDVMAELYRIVPAEVTLNLVEFDLKEGLKIRGWAKGNAQVTDFLIALQKSEMFTNEEMISSRGRRLDREEVVEFNLKCSLKKS